MLRGFSNILFDVLNNDMKLVCISEQILNEMERTRKLMYIIRPDNDDQKGLTKVIKKTISWGKSTKVLMFLYILCAIISLFARSDFVNLGYSHSAIGISGNTNDELIGIHHPKGWVVETVDDFDLGAGQITRYLEQSCSGLEKNYIDLFGHLHASRIDTVNGHGTVPSLFYDKERSGAWHVKIYLDKNKNIKYMVFIQLLAEKRLDKVSEVGYQRIIK